MKSSTLIPITTDQLDEIKKSTQSAIHIFRQLQIKGWPRIITIEGKHFIEKLN